MSNHARAAGRSSAEKPRTGQPDNSPVPRGQYGLRAMVHDLFWFVVVPLAFVGAPFVAWALAAVMPLGNFEAAELSPAAASLASDMHFGLLLFAVSGWLFLLGVWFYRTPDPDRGFTDYCRGGMVFALLLYVWALAPSLVNLLTTVLTTVLTKGSA